MRIVLVWLLLLGTFGAYAGEAESVLAHPPFAAYFSCSEHWKGNLKGLGDELGVDCLIQELVEADGRTWLRAYRGDGSRNEDWFGWGHDVISPCACKVVRVNTNPTTNTPGIMGRPPASFIVLERADGVFFLLAHVAGLKVQVGTSVAAGEVIAVVGNNGYARSPHIHMGAWRGNMPLQIRFDQEAMGRLLEK